MNNLRGVVSRGFFLNSHEKCTLSENSRENHGLQCERWGTLAVKCMGQRTQLCYSLYILPFRGSDSSFYIETMDDSEMLHSAEISRQVEIRWTWFINLAHLCMCESHIEIMNFYYTRSIEANINTCFKLN